MTKKILTAFIAATLLLPTVAQAAPKLQNTTIAPTMAILDTALDMSIPAFKDKVIYEVCTLEWSTCSNGKPFMEGPGAASMPLKYMATREFSHGTQMVSAAIATNPDAKIIFIRIVGNTPSGSRQTVGPRGINQALNWVYANKDKYNIQAVTMAQGHHNLRSGTNYCPMQSNIVTSVDNLLSAGIPSFFPAGNGYDNKRLDWPACQPNSIAVGATDQQDEISTYSNYDPLLIDFYALGTMRVYVPGGGEAYGAGSSVSVQVAGAQWLMLKSAKPNLSYTDLMGLLSKTAKSTRNAFISSNKLIDIGAAING
jgi:hypothetical protein